jgi:hypothetical protein
MGMHPEKQNRIQRFKSPITFKPIETKPGLFDIYLITSSIPDDMFAQSFLIHKTIQRGTQIVDKIELNTPPKGSFDIDEFLRFAIDIAGPVECMKGYEHHKNYKVIKRIYDELKNGSRRRKEGKST